MTWTRNFNNGVSGLAQVLYSVKCDCMCAHVCVCDFVCLCGVFLCVCACVCLYLTMTVFMVVRIIACFCDCVCVRVCGSVSLCVYDCADPDELVCLDHFCYRRIEHIHVSMLA